MYLAMLSLLVEIYCFVHDSQQCKRFVTFNGYYLYSYLIIFDSMYLPALVFVFVFLKKIQVGIDFCVSALDQWEKFATLNGLYFVHAVLVFVFCKK